MNREIYDRITSKKEFSQLPKQDVERAYSHFEKRQTTEEEKIKLTRNLLREAFSAFSSSKLLSLPEKDAEWILKKHLSTKERANFYEEVYKRILGGFGRKISVIDLGAGINGFSYPFFKKAGFDVSYTGIEAIGQLVFLTEQYFKKKKIKGKMVHMSLFDIEGLKKIIKKTEMPRAILMFKVIDSLEMLEPDFSKKLIMEIAHNTERGVVSFATESMIRRTKFRADRRWFIDFLKENFTILDDFEIGKERYIVFSK